jgi:aspartokinase
MLLSTGERTTMALLCIPLNGLELRFHYCLQSGIITNDNHNEATVIEVRHFVFKMNLPKVRL